MGQETRSGSLDADSDSAARVDKQQNAVRWMTD